jgi:hypothetical protein
MGKISTRRNKPSKYSLIIAYHKPCPLSPGLFEVTFETLLTVIATSQLKAIQLIRKHYSDKAVTCPLDTEAGSFVRRDRVFKKVCSHPELLPYY